MSETDPRPQVLELETPPPCCKHKTLLLGDDTTYRCICGYRQERLAKHQIVMQAFKDGDTTQISDTENN